MIACGSKSTDSKNKDNMSENIPADSTKVLLETTMGNVTVLLYDDTPVHRNNFVKLVNEGYYDGTLFHRVINEFMIQGGDPDSREAPKGKMLGSGGPDYTLPAEIEYPGRFHRRGVLAAARQGDEVNPERRSSGSQFYIVTGQTYNDSTLTQYAKSLRASRVAEIFQRLRGENRDRILELSRAKDTEALNQLRDAMVETAEAEADRTPIFTPEQWEAYTTVGGTPHLDGQYTVFGEVVDGMEVVDAIQKVETDRGDRPVEDVRIIKASVVK